MDSKLKTHSDEAPPQQAGDREWERILSAKRSYPKLEKFAAEALR